MIAASDVQHYWEPDPVPVGVDRNALFEVVAKCGKTSFFPAWLLLGYERAVSDDVPEPEVTCQGCANELALDALRAKLNTYSPEMHVARRVIFHRAGAITGGPVDNLESVLDLLTHPDMREPVERLVSLAAEERAQAQAASEEPLADWERAILEDAVEGSPCPEPVLCNGHKGDFAKCTRSCFELR